MACRNLTNYFLVLVVSITAEAVFVASIADFTGMDGMLVLESSLRLDSDCCLSGTFHKPVSWSRITLITMFPL